MPPILPGEPGGTGSAVLRAPVSVTLPRWLWINFLGWAHTDYEPHTIPWVDQMVTEVERAVDGP